MEPTNGTINDSDLMWQILCSKDLRFKIILEGIAIYKNNQIKKYDFVINHNSLSKSVPIIIPLTAE